MKILYGAGNTSGANLQLSRFLQHSSHEVKIAAYVRNHRYLDYINWSLDALQINNGYQQKKVNELFGHTGVPPISYYEASEILDDLAEWNPDLVISDAELITAHIAETFEVPLWICSPLCLATGTEWDKSQMSRKSSIRKTISLLKRIPNPSRMFIYSPLCDMHMRPMIRKNFEWLRPYHTQPSEITTDFEALKSPGFSYLSALATVITGETSLLADVFYTGAEFYISPDMSDPESVLNAVMFDWYRVASNLGEIRDDAKYANKILSRADSYTYFLDKQSWSYLHEEVDEYARSI